MKPTADPNFGSLLIVGVSSQGDSVSAAIAVEPRVTVVSNTMALYFRLCLIDFQLPECLTSATVLTDIGNYSLFIFTGKAGYAASLTFAIVLRNLSMHTQVLRL